MLAALLTSTTTTAMSTKMFCQQRGVTLRFLAATTTTTSRRFNSSSSTTTSTTNHRPMSSLATSPADEDFEHQQQQQQQQQQPQLIHPKMVLILGKPGGGKGTISTKILQDFPAFRHLSTGDLLRQHVRNQTELGQQAKDYMDRGALVPDHLMIHLVLHDATTPQPPGSPYATHDDLTTTTTSMMTLIAPCVLLDGFPRNVAQAQALEECLAVDHVVNLNVPTETIVERIADRWIHPASGRVYSYSYQPPRKPGVDDVTGEPLVQRPDDQPETVRQRLAAYDEVTAPLVEYYQEKGILQTFTGTQSDVLYPQVKQWLLQQGF
ncbi:hypothetical protein ACA910_011837 [Epithemia clementina (nom. ined.)]